MDTWASKKDYFVESFDEMVSHLKSEMDELLSTEDFLNIFDGKDIVEDGARPADSQQIIMYLYLCHLKKKYNQGCKENVPDYPSTEYTRLYSTIVSMNWHKSDLPKRVINSSDAEEDWDSETYGRCTDTPTQESTEVCQIADKDTYFAEEQSLQTHKNTSNRVWMWFSPLFTLWNVAIPFFFPNLYQAKKFDWVKHNEYISQQKPKDRSLLYSHIAMCEYTLIQSADDLNCAETLLREAHYPQSVFMSSQSIEKCLKSLLRFHNYTFQFYISRHSATELVSYLQSHLSIRPDKYTPYRKFQDEFLYLCKVFESLGHETWTVDMPISIRSRYFNYQTDWNQPWESRFHYYVDSYPGVVFTPEIAQTGYEIAKRIFEMSEIIHEENVESFVE
jgi:HEPN domain-containing protein